MLKPQTEIPIEVDGKKVGLRYYVCGGFHTSHHTFTILFVHGIRTNALYFQPLATCLAQYGYRSIALEYPGYDQDKWGTHSSLDPFTIPIFSRYVHQSLKTLSNKHKISFKNWIMWGHSMGGAVVYNAVKQYPKMFNQTSYIVFEAPAFAHYLTFGTKAVIHLSKLIRTYYNKRKLSLGSLDQSKLTGHCDSYRILEANINSIRHPSNNFDVTTFELVGLNKIIWIWSPYDVVLHAKPPDIIPSIQQIRFKTSHDISSIAPKLVCDAFLSRLSD